MWTRVVMVAFVFGLLCVGTDAKAQATTQPAAAGGGGAPINVSATQPLVTTPPATTRPTNRSADETLRQMLQPQGEAAQPLQPAVDAPPATDATSGAAAVAPGGTPTKVLREGTLLLDRVGRLTPSDDGKSFEFTIDSDGRRMTDPPLILLPNKNLQKLADRIDNSYRDLKIRASGEVMEYRGRNYLLLQRWSVVPEVVQPLQ